MADSKDLDAAVIAALANDAQLSTLAPGGIYRDVAPQQRTAGVFGVVSLTSHEDDYQVGGAAYESALYLVKFVGESKNASSAQAAASRAHTVLQRVALSATGYKVLECAREERIAYVEPVDDGDRLFQHRGGYYRVIAEALS